jgi:1-pyrroline-5-carboxylate dehydrogenase
MSSAPAFKLTYSTMFDPPAALHQRFEQALEGLPAVEGQTHPMWIDGREAWAQQSFELRSPIDRTRLLGRFQLGQAEHAQAAVRAAHVASRSWAATPWQERLVLLRKAAALIEERVYQLSAALAVEVGKNRMEAIGEVQETADLITGTATRWRNDGFDKSAAGRPAARLHEPQQHRAAALWRVGW